MNKLLEHAVKAATKISDEFNRNKWDKSQINLALLSDTPAPAVAGVGGDTPKLDFLKGQSPTSEPIKDNTNFFKNFEAQVKERNERVKAENAATVANTAPVAPVTPVTEEKTVTPAPATVPSYTPPQPALETDKVMNSKTIITPEDGEYVLVEYNGQKIKCMWDGIHGKFLDNEDCLEIEYHLIDKWEALPKEEEAPAEKQKEQNTEDNDNTESAEKDEDKNCYYVTIIRDSIYPNIGSRSLIRMCDSKFIWHDTEGMEKKPMLKVCDNCKKKVMAIETHVE